MKNYKLVSKATSSGYKKIEKNVLDFGFHNINLIPVEHKGKIYVPTSYVCYEEVER
jgi:hypothetical protein